MRILAWSVVITTVLAARALAAPVSLVIDETASIVEYELCIEGDCDTDTSPVAGTIDIALDDYGSPSELTLHDFELIQLDDVDLRVDVILGHLAEAIRDGVARYAHPGTPYPPVPLSGNAYDLGHVPVDLEGTFSYEAGGSVCVLLSRLGLPCEDTYDLEELGTVDAETISGEVEVAGEEFTLLFEPLLELPLVVSGAVGQLSLLGHITARGAVPGCVQRPGPISDLRLVKAVEGMRLVWEPEPSSTNGYRAYSVSDKLRLPPNGDNPDADLECETLAPASTSCSIAGATAPRLLFEVVGVCGDGSEGAN